MVVRNRFEAGGPIGAAQIQIFNFCTNLSKLKPKFEIFTMYKKVSRWRWTTPVQNMSSHHYGTLCKCQI